MFRKDEIGNRYGRLLVISGAGVDKSRRAIWVCVCDCGKETVVRGGDLRSGGTLSCGCLQREKTIKANKGRTGELAARWNPNLTEEHRMNGRNIPGYNEWRSAVYERDNYTCQICGDNKGGNLVAHHLEAYNSNPNLRTTISNGITLCEVCHKNFHHQYGRGKNTEKQLIKFIGESKL